jgi:hydroxypyruvate isomerase
MAKLKHTVCYWCFDHPSFDFDAFCRDIKRIGYMGLEMVPEEKWDIAHRHGLELVTDIGHASIENGLNQVENHVRVEQELKTKIDKAVRVGMRALICFSGNRNGISEEQGLENTVTGFKRVAGYAEQKGVTLLLELLNSKVDHKGYQCDHTSWGLQVIQRVGSPSVKLLFDIYHMQIMEGDVIHTLSDNIGSIGHFHVAGNPGRNEPDDSQEIFYPAVIRAILATGYRGFLGQEFMPKGDPIRALEQAMKTCSPD